MSSVTTASIAARLSRQWRDRDAWILCADIFAALIAASLPWSTSLVAIFAVGLLLAIIPFLDLGAFLQSLKRPISLVPIALVALAVVGTLWSDAPWGVRLYAVGPTAKLLFLPVLFYHFERTTRALQVFIVFLASCTLLLAMSWLVAYHPELAFKKIGGHYGVPIKNYIDQSQEFALCAVTLAYPVVMLLRAKRILPAVLLIALSLSFVVNMAFVVVSRTALVTMPVLLVVFALLHLRWRSIVIILGLTAVLAGLAWETSPQLRKIGDSFSSDYRLYKEENKPTSLGLRLEFWQKSLRFFADAPIIGHGTGSTQGLFVQAAVDHSGAEAEVINNPHNQTLNVAVQWGTVGIVVLYAMWLLHLLLFRGEGLMAWIGLMVVLQNIFTSLFNSHIFDFNEGWMYVLGVGIAGGTLLRQGSRQAEPEPGNSLQP